MSQRQRGQALVKVVLGTEGQEAGTVVVMPLHGLRERKREHRSWDFLGGRRLGTTNRCPGGNSGWLCPLRGGQLLLLSDEDGLVPRHMSSRKHRALGRES